jgi:hypothetical protein
MHALVQNRRVILQASWRETRWFYDKLEVRRRFFKGEESLSLISTETEGLAEQRLGGPVRCGLLQEIEHDDNAKNLKKVWSC